MILRSSFLLSHSYEDRKRHRKEAEKARKQADLERRREEVRTAGQGQAPPGVAPCLRHTLAGLFAILSSECVCLTSEMRCSMLFLPRPAGCLSCAAGPAAV